MKEKIATEKKLEDIQIELTSLIKQKTELTKHWKAEKAFIEKINKIKEEIDNFKKEAEKYEIEGDLGKVAEIRYGTLIQLEDVLERTKIQLSELQSIKKLLKQEVNSEDIAEVASKWTGIPINKILETEKIKLIAMDEELHKRVISQDKAINAVSSAIRRSRAGLQDENRPIGSFLFLGSTGVGKTELARTLADFLFNDGKLLLRFDMSEYMEKHSISRLIGAPPGYIGYEQGGQLTESVRNHPYSVLLFDEIEKANVEVYNILLQVLDDGRLTDGQGKIVNFKNTIIILTSNIGADIIQDILPNLNEENKISMLKNAESIILDQVKKVLRPEFINRLDEIVFFEPLLSKDILKIADLHISILKQRLQKIDLDLEISELAIYKIVKDGFNINYGARPLKRLIQREITDRLSLGILSSEFNGGDKIFVDVNINNEFEFSKNKLTIY